MRRSFAILLILVLGFGARGADARFAPPIVDQKVDPANFPQGLQFTEPDVAYTPTVIYPVEMLSGILGEVKLCVKIDSLGYPTRIAVFKATERVFERYAVANAMQTQWKNLALAKWTPEGWFMCDVKFSRHD